MRLQVSAGARVLPFSAGEPLRGRCSAHCTNVLSPCVYKAALMDVISSKQAFHLFWQLSHTRFPSRNDLAQIHGKCFGSTWLFRGRKRCSSIPTCIFKAGEFFCLKGLISPPVFFPGIMLGVRGYEIRQPRCIRDVA